MTFALWRRRLKPTRAVFAEVQVSAPVLHLVSGAKLEVAIGGEAAWTGLGLLFKTLESAAP